MTREDSMPDDEKVVDFTQKRKESIEQKRRSFERDVFQKFLIKMNLLT